MNNYEFKATKLIADAFEKHGVKFDCVSNHESEQLLAGFPVDCGPNVIMRFISRDNDNDVAVRIFGLISNIPTEKRNHIMEACNELNQKMRFIKFYLGTEGSINIEYDFPVSSPDDGIGEMAFEIFVRTMHILDSEYKIFIKALYKDEELCAQEYSIPAALIQKLQEFRKMREAHMTDAGNTTDDEDFDDFEPDAEADDSPEDVAS